MEENMLIEWHITIMTLMIFISLIMINDGINLFKHIMIYVIIKSWSVITLHELSGRMLEKYILIDMTNVKYICGLECHLIK